MSTIQKSKILVTGAASGIGRATAMEFARRGGDLVLVDRNPEGLASLQTEIKALSANHGNVIGSVMGQIVVDLSTRCGAEEVVEYALRECEGVDILMNCAGIAQVTPVLQTTIDEFEQLMAVNFWATVIISQGLLPTMVERKRGHLVNIASVSGLVGIPAFVAYGTSKFGVVGYSEGVRNELRDAGVRVTLVCPGIVDTPMKQNLKRKGYDKKVTESVEQGYPVDRLAKDIAQAVHDDTELITPAGSVLWWLKRVAPAYVGKYVTKTTRHFRDAEIS